MTILLGALAGCLQAPVVVCDDGSVCATGTTCVRIEAATLCATAEHYTACANLAENQACTVGATPGNCKGGVCFPQRCGDDYVDKAAGEVCDGNDTSPTGYCTEDCRSTGVCGNEYIDRTRGEHCDSGPYGLGRDGCSSHCLQEEAHWDEITQPPPMQRARAAMAYDRARKRMVLFGGRMKQGDLDVELDDTWEFDGTNWIYIPTLVTPPARQHHVMAYDEVRQQIVMFGGLAPDTVALDDTWTWDGATWTNKPTAMHPSARYGAAMAFDAARGEVVLFGGVADLNDTWRWNGSAWKEATNATRPPGRGFGQLSNDRDRQRLVLLGGVGFNDTWEWDGSDWLQRTPATSPPARIFQPMAYSDTAKRTLFVAGIDGSWTWDGTNWSLLPTRTTDLTGSLMQFDPDENSFVMFGGQDNSFDYVDETYRVSAIGVAVKVPRAAMPDVRAGHSLDYNPNTGDLYMFGGSDKNRDLDETWRYRHGTWRQLSPPFAPSPRRFHASAFDPLRNKLVVFGGLFPGSVYNDVWELDGATEAWRNQTPTSGPQPTPSFSATMTFDAVRKRVLLSGGSDMSGAVVNEVWEWDGANRQWIDRTPPAANNAIRKIGDAVAFDQRRGHAVLVTPSGTWEWDSNAGSWSLKAAPEASPPPRINAAFAYDPLRATMVLFGGSNNRLVRHDLWEWDGSVWQELFLASSPPTLQLTDLAYDAVNARFVFFGGNRGGREIDDSWTLSYRSTGSPAETCRAATLDADGDGLAGCADPDCWGVCTPLCPPYVSCDMTAPRCGDGVCNTSLETAQLCPSDCH
jgi:hypothetical protein